MFETQDLEKLCCHYTSEDGKVSIAVRQAAGDTRPAQDIAVEYNDTVIYPDKVRLNYYYYRDDYFSITDMMKAKDGEFFVTDWLRNRNTLEYLGAWESMNNPNFNYGEFATIRNQAGRYGGTYAHKDIALQFCMWISPFFQLYVIREYQRLKAQEQNPLLGEWNVKRVLSKVNYTIHTDAVKEFIVPQIDEKDQSFAYASEADLLNIALWGCTAHSGGIRRETGMLSEEDGIRTVGASERDRGGEAVP